jgi:hypothetical protein
MVTVNPAIVNVADRAAPVYAVALNTAVPFPLPGEPLSSVSHVELLDAVQAQPVLAVTGKESVKPEVSCPTVAVPTA